MIAVDLIFFIIVVLVKLQMSHVCALVTYFVYQNLTYHVTRIFLVKWTSNITDSDWYYLSVADPGFPSGAPA